MGTWVQAYLNSSTFLGAGGNRLGSLGGGPINAGAFSAQPLPDRAGNLRMNYSCGDCGCCETPLPPGEGSFGIDDVYLCLHWLAFVS